MLGTRDWSRVALVGPLLAVAGCTVLGVVVDPGWLVMRCARVVTDPEQVRRLRASPELRMFTDRWGAPRTVRRKVPGTCRIHRRETAGIWPPEVASTGSGPVPTGEGGARLRRPIAVKAL